MRLLEARVVSNERVLGELRRRRDIQRPSPPKDILGTWLMWLDYPEVALGAKPGQFIMVRCGECVLPRPFSIHLATGNRIALLYAVWEDGRGTTWLSQRRAGDFVPVFGPLGNGFSVNPSSRNLILVAGGIGIAPLYFLAERASSEGRSVTLLYGTADRSRYQVSLPIEIVPATEDGSVGHRGLITDMLPDFLNRADQVFACGPLPMHRQMARLSKGKSVQVSLETMMGCGVGVCFSCTVRTTNGLKQVCKDGPVFELQDIVWDDYYFADL